MCPTPGARRRGILVVEDDLAIREAISELLELEGHSTHQAANGREALQLLEKVDGACLILLDLNMPVMNGFEFAEALRGDHLLADIPIVVITAFGDTVGRIGARAVLQKPVDVDALLSLVRQHCDPAPVP